MRLTRPMGTVTMEDLEELDHVSAELLVKTVKGKHLFRGMDHAP